MALPGCKLTVLVEPPTAFVKISGRAAAESACEFKQVVLRSRGEGVTRHCLDLTGCLLMDSTFSGVLAGLAGGPGPDEDRDRFTLVGANARVLDLLDNLGVLGLVDVVTSDGHLAGRDDGEEIKLGAPSKGDTARCCLEAHRLLMQLKPENEAKFRPVTDMLEEQISPGKAL